MKCSLSKIAQIVCMIIVASFLHVGLVYSQAKVGEIPKLVQKDGRFALLVDGEPFFMFGGQSGNSSTWPAMLPNVWNTIESMNANTLEIPIYWEQVEPQPGKYDFSMVQMLLDQARERNKRLVILWFATWKNGSNHYMPEWMKKDAKKYPNVMNEEGKYVDTPSPHAQATMEADAKAFAEFMKYLKQADPQYTVIMVQVQNEPGSWYSVRDYSPAAEKIFKQPVPAALLNSKTLRELNVPTTAKGNWEEVFGKDADEYFHAWHVASYINYVAAAGKAVYPLPMFVNVALRDPLTNPPATSYESGGATDNVIPIWKVAAPSIDLVAPDIYLRGHERVLKVIDLYTRDDNALMVPEISGASNIYLYKVIEKGIGFSPFGIDRNNRPGVDFKTPETPLGRDYKLLAPLAKQLAQWGYEGKIRSVVEPEDHSDERIDLGNWEAVLTFGPARRGTAAPANAEPRPVTGKAMIVKLGENEFLAVGSNCRFTFNTKGKNAGKDWQYLKVEEGYYENGKFQMQRVLNGDQTDWGGPYIGDEPSLLHITLYTR
ncbi:hypothetical protein M2459_001908 [Parabacteroides sp. PF5-5]|uniref:DUF5597 domain-containing protein n=1 Tax=unclassified Parabacteroides TaxID=2649774 RepID=UPI002476D7D0|nr:MULTISPECIES: DUF5597 domain-containing protein [unclassified Parabacteroides]MDH6305455.1 hypothetical protein [Parabacteroides sp. PH5-39]MDH6316165.1 hypothetical protein [Parabacteroides sp. PF5-13]MDH6320315.1 hypothetical protein [Parabacteroides sp. PH5-13]MDH6324045.1 hypothetical protein [Parabacteroides sp. PH5-8]MDH6327356.1 hypothetical protein [Parabacteroides sp. PH5-41]